MTNQPLTGNFLFNVAGTLAFFVEGALSIDAIVIHQPLNTTHNFNIGDNYSLSLNVSSNFSVGNWWYSLYDVQHSEYNVMNASFTPNTTFEAVRWSNILYVYANKSDGTKIVSEELMFYINVSDSAPVLSNLSSEILVCEGSSLTYNYTVLDLDEDDIINSISLINPFFVYPQYSPGSRYEISPQIISGILSKNRVGLYELTVSANDGTYVDSERTNITVIEINNAPVMSSIPTRTIWTQGDNSTLFLEVEVTDTEDGLSSSGNFTFNITLTNGSASPFGINDYGEINITEGSLNVGVYATTICAEDIGLSNPHQNISYCGQDGGSLSDCSSFSLTVTDDNRAPEITNYTPSDIYLNVSGEVELDFQVTESDADGTEPDTLWYVDDSLAETDIGGLVDNFSYTFSCGVSGNHSVKVVATDGLLTDSVTWNLTVSLVTCSITSGSTGGGGGSGGGAAGGCGEKWGCEDWKSCRNAEVALDSGVLNKEEFVDISNDCLANGYPGESCGYQLRECFDVNYCSTFYFLPGRLQACYYFEGPSCFDGVNNCHDGSCEILVDCGGPCNSCPTCDDGKRNQGEQGVDCGGPCLNVCKLRIPFLERPEIRYFLISFILILIALVIFMLKEIFKAEERVKKLK